MSIIEFVTQMCQHAGITSETLVVEQRDEEDQIVIQITLDQEESGLLIGNRGETLDAMQRLTRLVFQKESEKRLIVNVNEYRQQRQEKVEDIATQSARKVLESGRPYYLENLNSQERFLVHSTISENPEFTNLTTESEGEGRNRRLVIFMKEDVVDEPSYQE
jgi:spoIIIJ-associated protein